jgi:hypothetical protein
VLQPKTGIITTANQRPTMSDAKNYSGGCHCGQVRFDVTADLDKVYSCNCSICVKRGALWAFVPPESFALRAGAEAQVDYQFNKKIIHHLFRGQCGVGSFSQGIAPSGKKMVAINVRCLDGVDLSALTLTPVDGKKW